MRLTYERVGLAKVQRGDTRNCCHVLHLLCGHTLLHQAPSCFVCAEGDMPQGSQQQPLLSAEEAQKVLQQLISRALATELLAPIHANEVCLDLNIQDTCVHSKLHYKRGTFVGS